MNITLETVRKTLRNAFGRESFVAAFIKRVEDNPDIPTACIDAHGVMQVNPDFAANYVQGPEDLFSLIAHELMHPLFGHFVHGTGQLENLGADAVINACLSVVYGQHSGQGHLFRRFYKAEGIEALLRPGSDLRYSRYARLYAQLYPCRDERGKLSTGEVIRSLKVLTDTESVPAIVLLGGHTEQPSGQAEDGSVPFPADVRGQIAEDLRNAIRKGFSRQAGFAEHLEDFLIEVLDTHRTLKKAMLERFLTDRKLDRFRTAVDRPRTGVSPIPLQPSKRDFVMLAAGVPPFHYHNQARRPGQEEKGLAVYLDVSGSVNDHLPEIVGLLRSLKRDLHTVFLFSNAVTEKPFASLLRGEVRTTYGTDFDCIAQHLIERNLDKAVILTDGYATMKPDNMHELLRRKVKALTVLFGGRETCPELLPLGEVVLLSEVAR